MDYGLHRAEYEHGIDHEIAHDLGHHNESDEHHVEEEEGHAGAHWRDDKYHDHGGFDLRDHGSEEAMHGSLHFNTHKNGVEHLENERQHSEGIIRNKFRYNDEFPHHSKASYDHYLV